MRRGTPLTRMSAPYPSWVGASSVVFGLIRLRRLSNAASGRCHDHGRLLASKLLLKNLWVAWNQGLDKVKYPEPVWPTPPEAGGNRAAATG